MEYSQTILLKNGKEALLRNGDFPDGSAVYEVFNLTHAETVEEAVFLGQVVLGIVIPSHLQTL